MLHEFITRNRQEIIDRCRAKVAQRPAAPITKAEIDHGVPVFLNQLIDALRREHSASLEITETATRHGYDLFWQGLTVSQVVHDYGDVCQSVTELAVETVEAISTEDFRILNRCLDDAIASAVTEYGRQRPQRRDGAADERQGIDVLAGDLRNAIQSASIALEVVKAGTVGLEGSAGRRLDQSLGVAHDLTHRLLAEVYATKLGRTMHS